MASSSWSTPVEWSNLTRTARLRRATDLFLEMAQIRLDLTILDQVYKTAAELGAVVESADDGLSMYSSMHPDSCTKEAYKARVEFLRSVATQVQSQEFISVLENALAAKATTAGLGLDASQVVWTMSGKFPNHPAARELMLYLAARQLGPVFDRIGLHQTLLDPSVVPSNITVRTPKWVASYAQSLAPSSVGEVYDLDDRELDYLLGLRQTSRRLEDLPKIVKAARSLARASA